MNSFLFFLQIHYMQLHSETFSKKSILCTNCFLYHKNRALNYNENVPVTRAVKINHDKYHLEQNIIAEKKLKVPDLFCRIET